MAILAIVLVAALGATLLRPEWLPGRSGDTETGQITLPDAPEPGGRGLPDGADPVDAEGNPRCHTVTEVLDCVEWAATVPDASDVLGVLPLDDEHVVVYASRDLIALLDVRARAVRWTQTSVPFGRLAVAHDTLVLTDAEILMGLDRATGEVRWERDDLATEPRTDERVPPLRLVTGINSRINSPLVVVEVAGSQDRALGIDSTDGETRWEQPLEAAEDLRLVGGTLLAVTQGPPDDSAPGPAPSRPPPTVRSLDPDTGETRWRAEGRPVTPSWWADAAPSGPSQLALVANGRVRLVDTDSGEQLLEVPGTAAALNDELVVVRRAEPPTVSAYEREGGALRWSSEFVDVPADDPRSASLDVASGVVVLQRRLGRVDAMLALLDAGTGDLVYRFDRGGGASLRPSSGEELTIDAANLAGWSIDEGTFAVVHQRGDDRTLWLVDLEDRQLRAATVDPNVGRPIITAELVALVGETGPVLRHRDALDRPWKLTVDGPRVVTADPLLFGGGNRLFSVELPAP